MLVLFLAACSRGEAARTETARGDSAPAASPAPEAAAQPAAPAAPAEAGASRSFSSVLSRFEMKVPDVWAQRFTASERTQPVEYPGASSVVEFVFLPESGGEPPALLTIVRYPRAAWERSKATLPSATLLQEVGQDAFVLVPAGKNPYPAGSADNAAFERMRVGEERIKPGFAGR